MPEHGQIPVSGRGFGARTSGFRAPPAKCRSGRCPASRARLFRHEDVPCRSGSEPPPRSGPPPPAPRQEGRRSARASGTGGPAPAHPARAQRYTCGHAHAASPPETQGSHPAHPAARASARPPQPRGTGPYRGCCRGAVRASALRGLRAGTVPPAAALRELPLGGRSPGATHRRAGALLAGDHLASQQRRVLPRTAAVAARTRPPRLRTHDRRPRDGGLPRRGPDTDVGAARPERPGRHAGHAFRRERRRTWTTIRSFAKPPATPATAGCS